MVVRTNFYGWSAPKSRTIAEFFFNKLSRDEEVSGFTDSIVSFTDVDLLIRDIRLLFELDYSGIIHLGSSESISKYDFAFTLAKRFDFNPQLVKKESQMNVLSVPRGSNLSLNTGLFSNLTGRIAPSASDGLESLYRSHSSGRQCELKRISM
jgi:dTDP-4-dehydrorhamnose reductase